MRVVGIDIGGTNADGVIIEDGMILSKAKIPADQKNLAATITKLLDHIIENLPTSALCESSIEKRQSISRIQLSSTLCTNAIACGNLASVGMLIQSGAGVNPDFLDCGDYRVFLSGGVDHRGEVVQVPSTEESSAALNWFKKEGITSCGIVSKFSHRNPEVEKRLAEEAQQAGFAKAITTGHTLSGLPNFPRRVYTTWINAALMEQFQAFVQNFLAGTERLGLLLSEDLEKKNSVERGLSQRIQILKADGGTMPLLEAEKFPCEAVYSGPSASVMGALALAPQIKGDSIVLDIGGTTTDIALFAEGQPLLEPYGITVMGRPTLIRALNTRSVALGGDSKILIEIDSSGQEYLTICSKRLGTPVSLCGEENSKALEKGVTPSDAMVLLESLTGNRESAVSVLQQMVPNDPPIETAKKILRLFAAKVHNEVKTMIEEVFSRPVYTVSELLERKRLKPESVIVVGGPAAAMREELEKVFELPCVVPEHYEVANAIGAACTRPTLSLSLYANSGDGSLSIPEAGLYQKIERNFTMAEAKEMAAITLTKMAKESGLQKAPNIDFLEEEEMNTIQGFSSTGKIIRLKAQIVPALD